MTRHEQALSRFAQGGVIPAIPLALDEDGHYSEAGQRLLTRYYLESGADGIAIAVHTTQFEIRDPKYHLFETVLRTVSDEIDRFEHRTGRVIIKVSGVCGETPQAAEEAHTARSLGYDAALLSPGGLNEKSEEYMVTRTEAVAAVLPVIGFYLQTAVGGRRFSYDYWCRVAGTEGVVGIKCASFDRYSTVDVIRAAALSPRKDKITLYTGNDDNIVVDLLTPYRFTVDGQTYEKRFEGGLLGHFSVWTHRVREIFDMLKAERGETMPAELLTLAAEITDANAAVFDVANRFSGCIAGIHEVLRRQGLMQSIRCLNPAETLSPGQAAEIDRVCRLYPHLTDDAFVAQGLDEWCRDSLKHSGK